MNKKVCVIESVEYDSRDTSDMVNKINHFIKNKNVIDIKYTTVLKGIAILSRVMIIYTEENDE